jgi:hypothetical protein
MSMAQDSLVDCSTILPSASHSRLCLPRNVFCLMLSLTDGSPGGRLRMSDSAVWCCGCEEWSPAMSTGGGDEQLRVRAVCVAGVAGVRGLCGGHAEEYCAHVLGRARGLQACRRTVRTCEGVRE